MHKHKKSSIIFSFLLCSIFSLSACGKYGPPRPPEEYAPRAPRGIKATYIENKLSLEWGLPQTDVKGRELVYLHGFKILRREVPSIETLSITPELEIDSDITSENGRYSFTEIAYLPNDTITHFVDSKREARDNHKSVKNIHINPESLIVRFEDSNVEPGKTYMYKLSGVGKSEIEGPESEILKVSLLSPSKLPSGESLNVQSNIETVLLPNKDETVEDIFLQ